MSLAPDIVSRHAPEIRIDSREAYPPLDVDTWLDSGKLYWYDGVEPRQAFDGSAREVFSLPELEFRGRRLPEITRPWDSLRPPNGRVDGFVLTTGREPDLSFSRPDIVPLYYELVDGSYVTYWLFYPWSTAPRRIPGGLGTRLGFESLSAEEEQLVLESVAALQDSYPELVRAATPPRGPESISPRQLLKYLQDWWGPRWPVFHEGDWEGVSVELRPEGGRGRVAYFQHGKPQIVEPNGEERPRVYAALGSHASYPDVDPDSPGSPRVKRVEVLSEGDLLEIELVDVRAQRWFGFGGAWGAAGRMSDETGPLGPGERKGPRPFAIG